MQFGAPMHKIDEQLLACADFFQVRSQFVLLNTVIVVIFKHDDDSPAQTHFIQRPQGLSLAQLRQTHAVYTQVVEKQTLTPTAGIAQLDMIMQHPHTYGYLWKLMFAFIAGAAIAPMGFSGSVADGLISGGLSCLVQAIQLLGDNDILFVGTMEMVVAILVSFVARILNSIQGHIFCYSAISSSGVVLILPGFLVCGYHIFLLSLQTSAEIFFQCKVLLSLHPRTISQGQPRLSMQLCTL